ncbi:MAG: TolC family protein, partial [Bacteroidia bacterium]
GYVSSTVAETSKYPFGKQFQDNFNQAIGLNLSVPIFNNLIVKNNIAKAKINLQSVQLDELNIKNQLRKNIEQAYTDQLVAAKQYQAAKEEEKSEERSYSDMEKKFENGIVNATDFLIEKNNYNKVKQTLVQAKYNYTFKTKVIDFYLGKPLTTL